MPSCDFCGQAASFRCAACSNEQAASEVLTWYCNKECQKADWKQHKRQCKLDLLYRRVRQLERDQSSQVPTIAAEIGGIHARTISHMEQYICKTPISARPAATENEVGMCVSESVMEDMSKINTTKEQYTKEWKARVPKYLRDLCYTDREDEVPFHCRPVKRHVSDNKFGHAGEVNFTIDQFPADFEMLSFEKFVQFFSDEQGMSMDPFSMQELSFDRIIGRL